MTQEFVSTNHSRCLLLYQGVHVDIDIETSQIKCYQQFPCANYIDAVVDCYRD
jgi:hypothetical protein